MATRRYFFNNIMRDELYSNATHPEKHNLHQHSKHSFDSSTNALFELDEHYNMPLYEVANPEDPTEKHIAVGFDYSLLDDFLNTWKKKKEDLASGKITKEEYFEWKINWPHTED